jgi:hypothetical protein
VADQLQSAILVLLRRGGGRKREGRKCSQIATLFCLAAVAISIPPTFETLVRVWIAMCGGHQLLSRPPNAKEARRKWGELVGGEILGPFLWILFLSRRLAQTKRRRERRMSSHYLLLTHHSCFAATTHLWREHERGRGV